MSGQQVWGVVGLLATAGWCFSLFEWPVRNRFTWVVACLLSIGYCLNWALTDLGVIDDDPPPTAADGGGR